MTEDQKSYLRGKRYEGEKQTVGKKAKVILAHNGPINELDTKGGITAGRLGAEYGVGYNTIKRDAKFAGET